MAKHKIDQACEERIEIEIVVDCYNESERYSAWICYLEDKLEFPFRARCVTARKSSPLKSDTRGRASNASRRWPRRSDC
jgi:Calcium binding